MEDIKEHYKVFVLLLTVAMSLVVAHIAFVFGAFDEVFGDNWISGLILRYATEMGVSIRIALGVILIGYYIQFPKFKKLKFLETSEGRVVAVIFWLASLLVFIPINEFNGLTQKILYVVSLCAVFISTGMFTALFAKKRIKPNDDFGLKNDQRKIENDFSFSFKTEDGWLNIPNPFVGMFVNATPGSGKSVSFSFPMIEQGMAKGFSGITYDFKFPELTEYVYAAMKKHNPFNLKFRVLDFDKPGKSHRVNPIHPKFMRVKAHATDFASILFYNLNPESISSKDAFFTPSGLSLLEATMWYLRKFHVEYCTIPHVVAIINNPKYGRFLLDGMSKDLEIMGMISSVAEAIENEATDQLSGVMGTLKLSIRKLSDKNLFWLLSEPYSDDPVLDLELNNPDNPTQLCMGSREPTEAITPIIALVTMVAVKQMNVQKPNHQSWIMVDEAAQAFFKGLEKVPETGRSRKIATILLTQDISQMIVLYTEKLAKQLLSSLTNKFFGRVSEPSTVKYIKDLFGRDEKMVMGGSESDSKSSQGSTVSDSDSFSQQERELVSAMDMRKMKPGEFKGIIAESDTMEFDSRIKMSKPLKVEEIPDFACFDDGSPITEEDIEMNFLKIQKEANAIIESVLED